VGLERILGSLSKGWAVENFGVSLTVDSVEVWDLKKFQVLSCGGSVLFGKILESLSWGRRETGIF
jgi:hypothetical protein